VTEIHIFRHGETQWNIESRIQGFKDSPLTERGKSQAIAARSKIKGIDFDIAYCSTSSRAIETTKLLLNTDQIPLHKLDDLREISMGKWEGMTHAEVKQTYPKAYSDFQNKPHHFRAEQSESFLDLASRSVAVIQNIIKQHPDKEILIVSHGTLIKTLLTSLASRSLNELWEGPYAHNLCHSILIKEKSNDIVIKQYCDEVWNDDSPL